MRWLQTKKALQLIQAYYRYMYVGWFFTEILKHNDLSVYATDIKVKTWENSSFTLKWATIKQLLSDFHKHSDKENIFSYFSQIVVFRQIFSVMKELCDESKEFQNFLKSISKDQYISLIQTITFHRNILSHSADTHITLRPDDLLKRSIYIHEKRVTKLQFNYKTYFGKLWTWSDDYGVDMTIDYAALRAWQTYFSIVSLHQLFLLSELCFNLASIFLQRLQNRDAKKWNKN